MERRLSANKQEAFSSEKETQKTKKFETQIDFEFTEEIEDFNDKSPVKGKLRQLRTDSFQIESEEEVGRNRICPRWNFIFRLWKKNSI